MNIIYMAPGDITPYGQNAKKHPEEQVEHIANSIKEFGFRQPLVIDKDGVLIIGHGRLLAAKKLGLETVPVVKADDLTEEQVKALRLADNKTNESDWDYSLLDSQLEELLDFNMDRFGFVYEGGLSTSGEEEDEEPEDKTKLLPPSRVIGFSISAFGTNSECFLEVNLTEEEAAEFLAKFQQGDGSHFAEKLKEAINAL